MEKNKIKMIDVMDKLNIKNFIIATFGCLLFAVSVNMLIVPLHLYNGGFYGIAQLVKVLLKDGIGINLPSSIDITGIIYFLLNVPVFILSYKMFSKKFLLRSILMSATLTFMLTIIPIPKTKIIQDILTSCLIGGALSGIGIGLMLYAGYSAGGSDIIGLYFSKVKPGASVGKINIIINVIIFTICLFLYDIQTVIYSLIFVMVANVATDRIHEQNINVWLMVFTKVDGLPQKLTDKRRGISSWQGEGSYTKEGTFIHSIVISKFELQIFLEAIKELDPKAFIIKSEGCQVIGNFEKRLN